MTTHYHGTPITPRAVLDTLAGYSFCVSHFAPQDLARCLEIGVGVMLDNGAFTAWRQNRTIDWTVFYAWVEPFLSATTWAVIPDVIDGGESQNDALIEAWPHGHRGAPVWHMHESTARLLRLAEAWPRVCIGSSGAFRIIGTLRWHGRMVEAMNALCGGGPPPCAVHMLRGMQLAGSIYPFDSVDSTDIARNHNRGVPAARMAERWSRRHCPPTWTRRPFQHALSL